MTGRMHALRPAASAPARMPSLSEFFSLLGARLGAAMAGALAAVVAWRARADERAALASLDDRALRDIGLTRAETWVEIDRPFWP